MPARKIKLINGEIYHIVLRGVEKRLLFQEESNYCRAIRNFLEFNDVNPVSWSYRQHYYETGSRSNKRNTEKEQKKEQIVSILAFCLMPNHIHILLRQKRENGISTLMRKFGTGYAGYFNRKYKRSGYLFQGRFRAVHIKTDNQLRSVFVYIHTNPAVLIDPDWKNGGIKNPKEIIKFIENYRWSSYQNYLGKENFPLFIQCNLFNQMMTKEEWQRFVNDWVEEKSLSGWDKSVELE